MKYTLLIIFLIPLNCFAQFELTPQGLINNINPKEKFIVYEFEGKSMDDLYNLALQSITAMYVSPKDVISNVENKMISINGIANTYFKIIGLTQPICINYNLVMRFKDNKIRIDIPNINKLYYNNIEQTILPLSKSNSIRVKSIFKKDGSVRYEEAKSQIEKTFNSLVNKIISNIKEENNEEW